MFAILIIEPLSRDQDMNQCVLVIDSISLYICTQQWQQLKMVVALYFVHFYVSFWLWQKLSKMYQNSELAFVLC